jgi:hypothetical protein
MPITLCHTLIFFFELEFSSMKNFHKVIASLAVMLFSTNAFAARIVASSDEWLFTNRGFSEAGVASTTNFATNLATYLKGSAGAGNFLIYSDSLGLTNNSQFMNVLTAAGHNVTFVQSTSALPTLSGYDGVFVSGLQGGATSGTLTNYVNSGGGVFVAAGNGFNPGVEAGRWNGFLGNFGLSFENTYNGLQGVFSTSTSNHSLFNGVTGLYVDNGNNINIVSNNPLASVILRNGNSGLIGVYDSNGGTSVPEPTTVVLLGSAMFGVIRKKRREA